MAMRGMSQTVGKKETGRKGEEMGERDKGSKRAGWA